MLQDFFFCLENQDEIGACRLTPTSLVNPQEAVESRLLVEYLGQGYFHNVAKLYLCLLLRFLLEGVLEFSRGYVACSVITGGEPKQMRRCCCAPCSHTLTTLVFTY